MRTEAVLLAAAAGSLDPDADADAKATAIARKAESIIFMAAVNRVVVFQLVGATHQKKYICYGGEGHAVVLGNKQIRVFTPQFFWREGVSFLEGRLDAYNLWHCMQKFCPARCQNINSTKK